MTLALPLSQVYSTLHPLTDPAPPPEDGLGEDPAHVSAPPTAKVGSLQQHSTLSMVMRTKESERDQVGLRWGCRGEAEGGAAVGGAWGGTEGGAAVLDCFIVCECGVWWHTQVLLAHTV